jgi:nitrous oxidase accessory protein
VPAGSALRETLTRALPGTALCLEAGIHEGPIEVHGSVQLWGPRDAIIRSTGRGTTVRLAGDGAALVGITVDGSGTRFDLLDAAVHVSGKDHRVEHVRVVRATFGILVERASGAAIRANEVHGDPNLPFGLRGDGIRLWEAYDCIVEGNEIADSRDLVLWYASRNRVSDNRVLRGRYGGHLMYSHDNQLIRNRFVSNTTGLFLMYSRNVEVSSNLFAGSAGASGVGLGLKESGNLRVRGNQFVRDAIGIYVDTSPLGPEDRNDFSHNVFRLTDVAISFLGSARGSHFTENDFRDVRQSVEVQGRGTAAEGEWHANHFDDYGGYDLDGDGRGDVPYELRSVSSDLVSAHPALAFFRGTSALALAELIGRIVPLFEPRLLLRDPSPRTTPLPLERTDAS